jgi:hypothetical protein
MMIVVFAPILVSWNLFLAPLLIAAVTVMSLSFSYMAVVPAWQMWFAKPK